MDSFYLFSDNDNGNVFILIIKIIDLLFLI